MQVLHAKYGQMQGWNSLFGLLSELLIFGEQIARFLWANEQNSDSLLEKSKSLPLLFCKEQQERITHGLFFVMSDGSNSLTVTLL